MSYLISLLISLVTVVGTVTYTVFFPGQVSHGHHESVGHAITKAPEISAESGFTALALLAGVMLLAHEKYSRKSV